MRPPRFDRDRNVTADPAIADIAALLGDPSRAAIVGALMDGRALTATELATAGAIATSTASSHLARLVGAGLLSQVKQGRHRYFRIADAQVADAIETLQCLSAGRVDAKRSGPADGALRTARCCYDHLAGARGVALLDALVRARRVHAGDGNLRLTGAGEAWCTDFGIDLRTLRSARRPLCRPCLDWSERRMHLAGALGAALLDRMLALRYLARHRDGRALDVTASGRRFFERL